MAGKRPGKCEVRMAGSFFFLRFFQALDLAFDDQLLIAAERHAKFLGKALRAFPDKVNMRAFIQYQPRSADRIANALHAAHTASAQSCAIHHEGVKLNAAIAGEKAAAAGVKS